MKPSEPLDPELAASSSLHGKVVFVLATPGTGAETLLRALAELSEVVAVPLPTYLFSQGIGRLLETWHEEVFDQGMWRLCPAQDFLLAARQLADAPLAAALSANDGDFIVEYTPDHIGCLGDIRQLYPDAHAIHVVADGRHVAERLTHRPWAMPPRYAARRWIDDQQTLLEAADSAISTIRIEDLFADPKDCLRGLAARLGIEARGPALDAAAAHFGRNHRLPWTVPVGRAGAIVEIVGAPLLHHLGYEPVADRVQRLTAWTEMVATGAFGIGGRATKKLSEAVAERARSRGRRPARGASS
jgi:hypothetical protein